MRLRGLGALLKETFSKWSNDKVPKLAAALAYYTVFSLPSVLIVVIAIVGLVFGRQAAQGQIMGQIQDLIGESSAKAIEKIIENASKPASGVIATVVGLAMLLVGASGVFGELQDSLNTIWEVEPKPYRGIFGLIKDRFVSFTMVLGTGFLLLVSLVLSAALAAFSKFMGDLMPGLTFLLHVVNLVIPFAIITLLFAMIYKVLPERKIQWRDVWIGAAGTSLLFTLGKLAIGMYLGRSNVASTYGAAASVVIILVWVYYSAQILFFGAEFSRVYATKHGSHRAVQEKNAPPVEGNAPIEPAVPPVIAIGIKDKERQRVGPFVSGVMANVRAPEQPIKTKHGRSTAAIIGFCLGLLFGNMVKRG